MTMLRQNLLQSSLLNYRIQILILLLACLIGVFLSPFVEDYSRPKFINLLLFFNGIDKPVEGRSEIDDDGIPLFFISSASEPQRNPVSISHQGFRYWGIWNETHDEATKEKFLTIADWFVNNAVERNQGFIVWEYTYDFASLSAPWISSLRNGD